MRIAAFPFAVLALILTSSPLQAAKHAVTVDGLMRLRSLSDVRLSPDGRRVAYVVSTPSLKHADHEAVLYVVPAKGGSPLRMTYATHIFNRPLPAPHLRWSPDGAFLSFIGLVNDKPQIMIMSSRGGEAWAATDIASGVTQYEWSPDGKRIAFLAPAPVPAGELERKKNKTYVIHVDQEHRFPRLWVQDVGGSHPVALTPPEQYVVDFGWAPDGKSLAYSASRQGGFSAPYKTRIFSVSVAGGTPHSLVDRPGMNHAPAYSPDGRWIAFISTGGYRGMVAAENLFLVSAEGSPGSIRNLTAAQDAWIGEFTWSPDSRSILYIPTEQTTGSGEHMFEQPIMRIWLAGDRVETLIPGRVVNFSVTFSRDGRRIAYKCVQSRTMGDVFVMDLPGGHPSRITEINPELKQMDLGDLEPVHWTSFDGQEIWGLLLTPPGYRPGEKIPLVVYCHGGPIGGFTYGIFPQFAHIPGQVSPYPSEAMASAGMAILFPMPRGGSGYGTKGFRVILHTWGETDYKDILAGVDAMEARGLADPKRLGVMGASYGGFMTDWIVTHTGRFKAASTGASVSDLTQEYYLSDAGDFVAEYFGLPWDDAAELRAHSPISFVKNVTTPLLIQHGQDDQRVPLGQARAFYKALKVLHKTVEFDIYPRGGHVDFEPPLEREYMLRNLQWFIRWLKPKPLMNE